MNNRRLRSLTPAPIVLSLALACAPAALSAGDVTLDGLGTTYTQDFDSLANSGTSSSLPEGWYLDEAGTSAAVNGQYTAGTGSGNAGDTYSLGAAGSAERSFGGLLSGTLTPTIGARFVNATGGTITSLAIAYTGEQWRVGALARPDRLDFQVSTDATSLTTGTWSDQDALDFAGPDTGGAIGARDGNGATNRTDLSGTVTGLSVPPGAAFWIRWADVNASGADDALSVDDFSLTPSGVTGGDPVLTVGDASSPEGQSGTTTLSFTISLSAPAGPGGVTFDAATADGTATAPSDYISTALAGVTIPAGQSVHTVDVTANGDAVEEPDETFTVAVSNVTGADAGDLQGTGTILNDDVTITRIHEIQGAGHISPLAGTTRTTTGVVVALASNGFWMQDPDPDADPATSEGLFVFTSSGPRPAVGDTVRVTGTVTEFRPGNNAANLTTTELTSPTVTVLGSGGPLPAATLIGDGGRVPPAAVIDDDATGSVETSGSFDAQTDGIDFYESLEGMRVGIEDAVATGPRSDFGSNREIPVVADDGANAALRTPRGGIIVRPDDFNPERVILNDLVAGGPDLPAVDVGDRFPGTVVGVLDYNFSNFKLQVTDLPAPADGGLAREVTDPQGADEVSIGTFNVENLAATSPATKFDELATLVVDNLRSPDILAIEEIQDDNGATNDADTSADQTWAALIDAIAAAGGPTYAYTQIDPVDDADGGQPGGNIRQGFLYRTDRGVAFVDRPGANATTANSVQGSGDATRLEFSPGRIDPADAAFTASRKPLAAEFTVDGRTLFVIGNHFNSKGGDQPLFGPAQPPLLTSEVQRLQQAAIVNGFVDDLVAADPDAAVVVLGDINDFPFSAPMATLEGTGAERVLHNLMDTLPEDERYSYVFQGNSQALDHTLLSGHLIEERPFEYDVVHVNSEFADQASDHDPQVTRLVLEAPTVSVADAAVTEGDAGTTDLVVTLTRTGPLVAPSDVTVTTSDGTATAGEDYVAISETATFGAGESTAQVIVPVNGDTVVEPDETLTVTLSGGSNATIAVATATGTIQNDDTAPALPSITIGDATVREGDFGLRPMPFRLCLSSAPTGPASVRVATDGVTATPFLDYLPQSLRVSWRAGGPRCVTSPVAVIGDRRRESDERLKYRLSGASGATVADTYAVGTIRDDDR